jgi:antitoxin MazE
MRTKVGNWGNSLAVRIPRCYAREMNLKAGMKLDISLDDGGIILRPKSRPYTLQELVQGITPDNRHGETDWGHSVGREAW